MHHNCNDLSTFLQNFLCQRIVNCMKNVGNMSYAHCALIVILQNDKKTMFEKSKNIFYCGWYLILQITQMNTM